jgi:transglutaminase-like putative cysteine protease
MKAPASRLLIPAVILFLAVTGFGLLVAAFRKGTVETRSSRSFAFTYVVHVPKLPVGNHTMRIWIPVPRTGAHQRITHIQIASPIHYGISNEPQFGNRSAYLSFNTARVRAPFDVSLKFDARRSKYQIKLPEKDPAPSSDPFPPAIARYLLPDHLIPTGGIIGEASRQQTAGISEPLAKARRIYDYVIRSMHYDHRGTGWGHGNAIFACTMHHGNCTDFHSLFIGMARSAGIPARFEIGFALPPDRNQGRIADYHCWAEFYIAGIGWVPVDAAWAWLDPARRNFYFGGIGPNRIRFTRGRDLVLVPQQSAGPLNYFVYPYAELDDKPYTGLAYHFSFRNLPAVSTSAE